MTEQKTRNEIEQKDKWNLCALYPTDKEWEDDFNNLTKLIPMLGNYKGRVCATAENFIETLEFISDFQKKAERLGYYANLRLAEDNSDPISIERDARCVAVFTKASAESSYIKTEIITAREEKIHEYLIDPRLANHRISINKILRLRKHTLSANEERIIALAGNVGAIASNTFSALNDADLDFGKIKYNDEEIPLTHGSFSTLLLDDNRELREQAYKQYYKEYSKHENTIASLYAGSINGDIFISKSKNFNSTLEMKLFYDDIPKEVYTNLIATINSNLPVLHHYYEIRKKALNLTQLRHYDMYVPMTKGIKTHYTYEQATELTLKALKPLGFEYCDTLRKGLTGNWVDKYENKGKHSGAFSAGSYFGEPYILLNYKEDNLRDIFTLAHEAGHSMHSYYSAKSNPFEHYGYTIFEAETASTVNEQLLSHYLINISDDTNMKKFLLEKEIGNIVATLFRQTMFAEFELRTHEIVENGGALSPKILRDEYEMLLKKYFGEQLVLEPESSLEGFRIPHFYRSFYVYKYATGISAAIALSENILKEESGSLESYMSFLKSGGSRFPIESLKLAGVDMSKSHPIEKACKKFETLLEAFEKLI
ncbi:MAG: oligoendopeptidase F [Spirochaetales bacterium]|nr:oligoendopeptidase F [Spirochaetales bacterium]